MNSFPFGHVWLLVIKDGSMVCHVFILVYGPRCSFFSHLNTESLYVYVADN